MRAGTGRRPALGLVFLAVLLLLLPAGRAQAQPAAADPPPDARPGLDAALPPIRIGALWDLSGERQREGTAALIAARQAVEALNQRGGIGGHRLELVIADTWGEAERLLRKAKTLVDREGAVVLLGPSTPELVPALRGYADTRKVPVVLTAGEELLAPHRRGRAVTWSFGVYPPRSAVMRVLYQGLARRFIRRIGILASDDPAGSEAFLWLKAYAPEFRLEVAEAAHFGAKDTDMRSQLQAMKAEGAEMVVVWGPRSQGLTLLRSAYGLGLRLAVPPTLLSGDLLEVLPPGQELWAVLPPLLEGTDLAPSHVCAYAVGSYFRQILIWADDAAPEALFAGGAAWDAVHLVAVALQQAMYPPPPEDNATAPAPGPVPPPRTPAGIRDALEHMSAPYIGVLGIFHPSERDHIGLDPGSLLVVRRTPQKHWEPVEK
ncbi:amino acid ABC transporter substrate-binding protein [Dissulfurirhabdus thermomarina]|uniref:Amino acid ABC transporter substrate-binding protein n=1 Tax=Dissulfurirhabdus thermomarina TaxID=1765737 RepID=A0A6N9TNC9_DISTH|nr:ABC transporter substrate-binding protein [Dissulfurirhabdus thermomarina]NDY41940.1 amino acid ABC transporter substrate-binding protein [Dissulfurirhabdus thermomarina]NMX22924.1 amino acid ABC transporter substrate-binding protein [Dissulfurirhabdus thermomarina]